MGDDIIIYGMFQYRMQQIFQICLTKIPRLLEKDFLVKYLGINSTADATTLTQINLICNCKSSGIFIYIFQRLHDMIKTFILVSCLKQKSCSTSNFISVVRDVSRNHNIIEKVIFYPFTCYYIKYDIPQIKKNLISF